MNALQKTDDLIVSYLCNDITAESLQDLNDLILHDSTVQERFVTLLDQEIQLRKIFKTKNENVIPIGKTNGKRFMFSLRLLAAAGIVLCLGFFALWNLSVQNDPAISAMPFVLTRAQGSVTFKDSKGFVLDVQMGADIKTGTWIETGERASVGIAMDGGATKVEINQRSRLRVGLDEDIYDRPDRGLHLFEGRLSAVVDKQPLDMPFRITTRHAMAEVLGTQFSIATHDDYSRIDVAIGAVLWKGVDSTRSVIVKQGGSAVCKASGDMTMFGVPIFEEDFSGGLKNWHAYGENAKGDNYEFTEKQKKRTKIVDVSLGGKPAKAVQLDALEAPGWINISLQHTITNRMILVTFDYMATSVRSLASADISCMPKDTRRGQILFVGGPNLSVDRWCSAREEHVISRNSEDKFELWDKKYWAGDNLRFWRKTVYDKSIESVFLRISAKNLKLFITNVKVIPVLDTTVDMQSRTSWITAESVE